MITTSILKRQVWMADDDKFDHIVKNSPTMLRLNDQYKNHPYVEEFSKACSIMFVYETYALEGEADAKFFGGYICNLFQEDLLPNNKFCRQMINYMKMWKFLQKTLDLPLSTEIIKQTILSTGKNQHQIKKDDGVYQRTAYSHIYWPDRMRKNASCFRFD